MFKQAQWITAENCSGKKNCSFRCWRKFVLTDIPDKLELNIAASCNYLAYINGSLAGRGPARGSHGIFFYDTLDVSKFVRRGENTLAVMVHSHGQDNFICAPVSVPALKLELKGVLHSDETFCAQRALDYVEHNDVYTNLIGLADYQVLSQAPSADWVYGTGEAANWSKAQIAADPRLQLRKMAARPIPLLAERWAEPEKLVVCSELQIAEQQPEEPLGHWLDRWERKDIAAQVWKSGEIIPVRPPAAAEGIAFIFDFQQNRIGFPEIIIEGASGGEKVYLSYSEHLHKNRVPTRYANPSFIFTDCYTLASGVNKIGSAFVERGGRYMQIVVTGLSSELTVSRMGILEHRYPVQKRGTFCSSDPELNKLWDMAQETLSLCMTDIFTDCPWREHSFWTNDIVVEICTSLQLFGAEAIHKHAFKLLQTEQHSDGWIPGVIPDPGAFPMRFVIPAANLSLLRVLNDYYQYSGDKATVAEILPALERMLSAAESTCDETGLVRAPETSWNFYDWSHELHDVCFSGHREAMFNFLYISAIQYFLRLASETDYAVDTSCWQQRQKRVAEAVWREIPVRDGLIYNDCRYYEIQYQPPGAVHEPVPTQLAQAMALESGSVPEDLYQAVVDGMNDPRAISPDYYMSFYILREMRNAGLISEALQRIRRDWGYAIRSGEATIPEIGIVQHGKSALWGSGSLCHGFATGPVDFMQTALLGVMPSLPGFKEFTVRISPCDLEFARGNVPTPYGDIAIDWQRSGNDLAVKLQVPSGCNAVLEDGRKLSAGYYELKLPAGNS